MFDCCHYCTERHPGCHGNCEAYKQASAVFQAKNAEERKELEAITVIRESTQRKKNHYEIKRKNIGRKYAR